MRSSTEAKCISVPPTFTFRTRVIACRSYGVNEKIRSTRIPVPGSAQGSTMVCFVKVSGSTSGFKSMDRTRRRTSASRSRSAPRVMSMSLVSRGSPYSSTAWPPMTIYGMPMLSSAFAIRSSRRSNIDHLGHANVHLNAVQWILKRQCPQQAGLPVERLDNLQVVEEVRSLHSTLRSLKGLYQGRILDHRQPCFSPRLSYRVPSYSLGLLLQTCPIRTTANITRR